MTPERKHRMLRLRTTFDAWWHRGALVILIALSLGLLLFNRAEPQVFEEARGLVADAVAPAYEVAVTPISWVHQAVAEVQRYSDVYAENARLREEVARLRDWQHVALALEQRLAGYEALLNVKPAPAVPQLTARVIAEVGGPFVHALIINAGAQDGVKRGQAVIDSAGLVGRVITVGQGSARVLLLQDLSSRLPVVVGPANTRAVLIGDNSGQPRLDFLPPGVTLNAGDRVVTSSDGELLPPGLPVGVVTIGGDGYRVMPYAGQEQAEFVRLLEYAFPRDVDLPADADLVSDAPPPAGGAVPSQP